MSKEIIQWQKIWKKQKANYNYRDIKNFVLTIEKKDKQQKTNLLISFAIGTILLLIFTYYYSNIYLLIGAGIILITMFIMAIKFYKNKIAISNWETFNTLNFLNELKKKYKYSIRLMWLYSFFLLLGINISLYGLQNRLIVHIISSLFVIAITFLGVWKQKKKYDNHITELREMLKDS